MNERLPYEEQLNRQWDNLLLPDENMAWADMKRRLDEDENKKPVAWWQRGCMLWGFLLLALFGAGWLLLKPEKWFSKKDGIVKTQQVKNEKSEEPVNADTGKGNKLFRYPEANKQGNSTVDKSGFPTAEDKIISGDINKPVSLFDKSAKENSTTGTSPAVIKKSEGSIVAYSTPAGKKNRRQKKIIPVIKPSEDKNSGPGPDDKKDNQVQNNPDKKLKDTISAVANITAMKNESAVKSALPDSAGSQPKVSTKPDGANKKQENEKKKIPFIFSAGIAVHQQLPIAGQKLTPYNSLGRKGSIADYIPSVYVRLEKEKKWFLQSEFRYGAPQYTKEFIYRQQQDSGITPQFSTINAFSLKKTFYHQLPLTFNYYIKPGWSVGTGLQWNKLYATVAEQSTFRRDNFLQQDTLLSKKIVSQKKDSLLEFKKNYWQGVIETQYQWKRFSFGARYSFGLEPYIRFTLPGQPVKQERNQSFQVFVRYELWKQKK